jgi:hypothetical protein
MKNCPQCGQIDRVMAVKAIMGNNYADQMSTTLGVAYDPQTNTADPVFLRTLGGGDKVMSDIQRRLKLWTSPARIAYEISKFSPNSPLALELKSMRRNQFKFIGIGLAFGVAALVCIFNNGLVFGVALLIPELYFLTRADKYNIAKKKTSDKMPAIGEIQARRFNGGYCLRCAYPIEA